MASGEYSSSSSNSGMESSWHDLSKSDYAKVIFSDLYCNPHSSVGCRFQITDNVHEDPCDYVGLFKVGYDNLSECLVSKLLSQTECEEDGKLLRCTFKINELPPLEGGYYQFLYVTRDKEVCGASLPFAIGHTVPMTKDCSSDEDVVADRTEDDFLVVRSNLAEKNRQLESLLDKMQRSYMTLEEKLMKDFKEEVVKKQKLEEELKFIRLEMDKFSKKCKLIAVEHNIMYTSNEAVVEYLERKVALLESQLADTEHKIKELEVMKSTLEEEGNKAVCEKIRLQETVDELKATSEQKIAETEAIKYMMERKNEDKIAEVYEDRNLLSSQLENAQIMIKALEESKQLVVNEMSQMSEQIDEYRKKSLDLESELTALKMHFLEVQNKVRTKVELTEQRDEMEEMKLETEKLHAELEEKDAIISELKNEALKKDAVIEFLCVEKNNIQKAATAFESNYNDCVVRLKEAGEIYKKQYLEIQKLKKKIEKAKSSPNKDEKETAVAPPTEMKSLKTLSEEHWLLLNKMGGTKRAAQEYCQTKRSCVTKSEGILCIPTPSQNQSSDSDTGEHVLRHVEKKNTSDCPRQLSELGTPEGLHKKLDHQRSVNCNTVSFEKLTRHLLKKPQCLERKFKDVFGQTLDVTYLAVASEASEPSAPKSRESPELQSLIERNLAKLSVSCPSQPSISKSEDLKNVTEQNLGKPSNSDSTSEGQEMYTLPCPVCDGDIGVRGSSTEEMVKHLEMQHKQQMCPVCGRLFDMTLPEKYFAFHVEDHFMMKRK